MKEIAKLKEAILKEYPRYGENDTFQFSCHRNVKCFNKCCADVNIFLTPYDILRLKKKLGISSQEFLDKYAIIPIDRNQKYPVVLLSMDDSPEKRCQFVDAEKGCTVYEHRPWACRMYPVGMASPKEDDLAKEDKFYFILQESDCEGFKEDKKWTIKQWIEDQGGEEYGDLGNGFKEIVLHDRMQSDEPLDPKKLDMFFMVCYNIDSFRRFVFESRFLKMFEIDEFLLKDIKADDVELMKFGFEWLKFSLFGEPTMKIKEDVIEQKMNELKAAPKE